MVRARAGATRGRYPYRVAVLQTLDLRPGRSDFHIGPSHLRTVAPSHRRPVTPFTPSAAFHQG